MSQPILKFAEKSDLNELYQVYLQNYPGTSYSLNDLNEYFDAIPNAILIGLVDNKIVAHLFCHPINVNSYEFAHLWYLPKYFNTNGSYLYIWGAGILKEYRTTHNFAWTVQNKLFEYNLNKYKSITKSILYTVTDRKLYAWHLLAGYKLKYVINDVVINKELKHLAVLEFELRHHVEQNGYNRLKRIYGYVNTGIIPQFIER